MGKDFYAAPKVVGHEIVVKIEAICFSSVFVMPRDRREFERSGRQLVQNGNAISGARGDSGFDSLMQAVLDSVVHGLRAFNNEIATH